MQYSDGMKNMISPIVLTAAVLALAPAALSQQNTSAPRLVTVTGEAEIRVAPDVVVLTFGVEARATELDEAVAAHAEKIARLIKHIKEKNVADKCIQTDYINIRPSTTTACPGPNPRTTRSTNRSPSASRTSRTSRTFSPAR